MSQQVTKEKYSIETLRERNVSYDHQHWLTQKDVDMANNYVELIERTRSEITPQIGDRLVYVTEHGDYYGNALIDSRSAKAVSYTHLAAIGAALYEMSDDNHDIEHTVLTIRKVQRSYSPWSSKIYGLREVPKK